MSAPVVPREEKVKMVKVRVHLCQVVRVVRLDFFGKVERLGAWLVVGSGPEGSEFAKTAVRRTRPCQVKPGQSGSSVDNREL